MLKNMKIEINEQQPLEEVVSELGRLGYGQCFTSIQYGEFIVCRDFGVFFDSHGDDHDFTLTTLVELRSMSVETLKEM